MGRLAGERRYRGTHRVRLDRVVENFRDGGDARKRDGVLNLSKKASGWARQFELDPRGIATARDAREAEFSILRADAVGRRREFLASEDNVCGTCFADDGRGPKCARLASCGHRFCVDCVTRMARVHVREGTVNELVCPHPDCSSSMDPQTLREVLDDEEFAKFEAIALSKALDAMQDLVYCPRCEHPTIEDEDHCGRCPGCLYTFCGLCRSAWHARSEPCLSPPRRSGGTPRRLPNVRGGFTYIQRRDGRRLGRGVRRSQRSNVSRLSSGHRKPRDATR